MNLKTFPSYYYSLKDEDNMWQHIVFQLLRCYHYQYNWQLSQLYVLYSHPQIAIQVVNTVIFLLKGKFQHQLFCLASEKRKKQGNRSSQTISRVKRKTTQCSHTKNITHTWQGILTGRKFRLGILPRNKIPIGNSLVIIYSKI